MYYSITKEDFFNLCAVYSVVIITIIIVTVAVTKE